MIRRIALPIAGAVAIVGLTATGASAHDNAVTGTATCDQATGAWDVAWTVANDYRLSETLSNATRVADQLDGATITPYGDTIGVETVANGAGTLTLTVHGRWSDGFARDDTGSVTVGDDCTPPPPHHPKARHGYIHAQSFRSCARSERGVYVVAKHGVARVHLWHNTARTHWSLRAITKPGMVVRRDRAGKGPWVHRVHWVYRHLGTGHRCAPPSPTSSRRDPQTLTKTEWNAVAIGDKRVDDVRRLCGCIESPIPFHITFHGNDYKAYEYLTPVGNAFVFYRVNSAGQSIAGYQKDWCPGQPVLNIPSGDCQSAWN